MKATTKKNSQLTFQQRAVIEYKLKTGETPEKIIDTWDHEIHNRDPPSIQTIRFIKRQIEKGESVEPKKKGPKSRHILKKEKLIEIEKVIDQNDSNTYRDLSYRIELPLSTTYVAVKVLNYKQFNAIEEQILTEDQKLQRINFCTTFLHWNNSYKMLEWWSDESLFSVDDIVNFKQKSYFAQENEHRIIEKINNQKKVNIWAAICGDGKLIFEVLEGIQSSENYIQTLFNAFPFMDSKNSFLMQDGAGIHTSNDALDWINWLWKDRWIGLKSSRLQFPPYSPDLTPMDFSFWSLLKRNVARWDVCTTEELKVAIVKELNLLSKEMIINMCLDVVERCQKCIQNLGGRFEGK